MLEAWENDRFQKKMKMEQIIMMIILKRLYLRHNFVRPQKWLRYLKEINIELNMLCHKEKEPWKDKFVDNNFDVNITW